MSETIRTRRPGAIQRVWYRRLDLNLPSSIGDTGSWHADWVRLLPYRWRTLHRVYANAFGYFWVPCPLCDRPFGGHESGGVIPDPTRPPHGGVGICSACTRARAMQICDDRA